MPSTGLAWLARAGVFAALAAPGCSSVDDSSSVRGRGLLAARLSRDDDARIYEAAARASFEVDDPSLSLLLDARQLPRTVGLAPDGRLNATIAAELEQRGVIKGTCEPPLPTHGTAQCKAARPGYVLRFSPVFALHGDSTQVYVYAQKYDTPTSGVSETLRFERAYQVVREGGVWRAAREGRVPKEVRDEKK